MNCWCCKGPMAVTSEPVAFPYSVGLRTVPVRRSYRIAECGDCGFRSKRLSGYDAGRRKAYDTFWGEALARVGAGRPEVRRIKSLLAAAIREAGDGAPEALIGWLETAEAGSGLESEGE